MRQRRKRKRRLVNENNEDNKDWMISRVGDDDWLSNMNVQ